MRFTKIFQLLSTILIFRSLSIKTLYKRKKQSKKLHRIADSETINYWPRVVAVCCWVNISISWRWFISEICDHAEPSDRVLHTTLSSAGSKRTNTKIIHLSLPLRRQVVGRLLIVDNDNRRAIQTHKKKWNNHRSMAGCVWMSTEIYQVEWVWESALTDASSDINFNFDLMNHDEFMSKSNKINEFKFFWWGY